MTLPSNYQERIRLKLTQAFQPILLEIKDDSAKHAGHAGHNPLGETHFSVKIVSAAFNGQPKVDRHRKLYEVLATELQERVHALSLQTYAQDEYNL